MLTEIEQKILLKLARNAITDYSKKNKTSDFKDLPPIAKEKHGVFVSVFVNSKLRGCIGNLFPSDTLYESTIKNAIDAAYHDDRFSPLTKKEFDDLKIEISLLTDPVLLSCIDANHLLKKLNTEEGVILKKGLRMATFLPQVWEKIKDKEEFLAHLCLKVGLNVSAWLDSDVGVYVYRVEKFND